MADFIQPETAFHAGERSLQAKLGKVDMLDVVGKRVLRPFMTEQLQDFFADLDMIMISGRDDEGRPWATFLTGPKGFMKTGDDRKLLIDALPDRYDPLFDHLQAGTEVGMIGIQFDTRRRNRINGVITKRHESGLVIDIKQAFGNCPKYIYQQPNYSHQNDHILHQQPILSADMTTMIANANVFFMASGITDNPDERTSGMDMSHRGGEPGFIKVIDDKTLIFPDYKGNSFFQTLGNLTIDPRVGLFFIDFDQDIRLHITGTADILFDGYDEKAWPDAERLVKINIQDARLLKSEG